MNGPAPERPANGRARLPGFAVDALLVLFVALLLYWPDLDFGWFDIDDASYVTGNPLVTEPSAAHLRAILTEPYVGNWSPVHLLSYWLDRALGGDAPWVMHFSSNLWAAACALGVLGLGRMLLASRGAALAAALLFVVHPAHVEAVAWISSRKDLIAAAFGLPAWMCWLRYRRVAAQGGSPLSWYAASLVLFVLALAGKLSIVVLPAVLVAHDVLVERRRGVGVLLDKLPHVLCVLGFGLVVAGAQPETNVVRGAGELAQIAFALFMQLSGLGAPVVFRPVPDPGLAFGAELAQGAAVLGVVAGGLCLLRCRPSGLVLALATLFALLPAQALRFVYPVSDRYLFLATAPFALLLAGAVRDLLVANRRAGLAALTALAALGGWWSFVTVRTLHEWGDPRSSWFASAQRVSDINTHEYLGEHWLASAEELLKARAAGAPLPEHALDLTGALGFDERRRAILQHEWDEGLAHRPLTDALVKDLLDRAGEQFELAFAIPTERALPSLVYRNGRLFDLRGDHAAALREFERAYAEAERYPVEIVSRVFRVQSLYAMGLMAERMGDKRRALDLLRRARAEQEASGEMSDDLERGLERLERELEREVDGG